ncbi:hypothetical protein ACT3OH_15510 [Vreelandella zhanjiangensis]|uniref:hypothetical protein n=1 Tax=Vreelandella zhanjiangensis TaxID=1121960 RepID=UPI00402A8753
MNTVLIFKSGFFKVASVIDANQNYGSILGSRIDKYEYEAVSDKSGHIHVDKALEYLENSLKKKSVVKKIFPTSCLALKQFCYGSTKNNKREFKFFEKKAKELGCSLNWVNIEEFPSKRVKVENALLKEEITSAYSEFLHGRKFVSKSILHQTTSYALSLLAAWETLHEIVPSLLVVANDHSPIPVAFAKVAELKGAKVAYLQHAEVTDSFPALDFSYSILRNKISFDTYARKGISGKAIYCDRLAVGLTKEDLLERFNKLKFNEHVSVVIYPSSIFNDQSYRKLVDVLAHNHFVSSLSVKFHPSFKDFDRVRDDRVTVLEAMPDEPHVAICGNSSVVVELSANGNFVFNCFDLDDIIHDYYGFVKKRISNKLELEDASSQFWKSVAIEEIIPSLSDYIPSIRSPRNQLEFYRAKEVFLEMLSQNVMEDIRPIWFERDVFLFSKPLLSLLRKGQSIPYDDFWIIVNLNKLFDNRDIRLQTLYTEAKLDECNSILEFWLNTKVMEWNGRIPSPVQLSAHVSFVKNFKYHRKLKGWLELKCFDIILRFGKFGQVDDFLKSASILNVYNLGINKKIAFLNYINSNEEQRDSLVQFYDVNKDMSLTGLDKVKIMVQADVEIANYSMFQSYRDVEEAFMKAHPRLSQEYMDLVRAPYQDFGDRACLIDIKRNRGEEQKFIDLIKQKLNSGDGFSFIRLSDGEGFIFQNLSDHFTINDSSNRQRHWWGEEIPAEIRDELLFDLLEAVEAADVLGIPSIYRFVRDHSDKTFSLKQSLQGRGLVAVLAGLRYIDTPNKLYTDDKANIATFNRMEIVSALAKQAQKVIVVNSGSAASVKQAFSDFFEFEHIQVPTHHKTSLNDKYHSSPRPLPYVYREVVAKIEASTTQGTLVLVGAGVAGKVFMHAAKKRGGVALDIGSAMDQFLSGGIHSLF